MKGLFKARIKYLRKQRFRLIIGKSNREKNLCALEIGREVGERWGEGRNLYRFFRQQRNYKFVLDIFVTR